MLYVSICSAKKPKDTDIVYCMEARYVFNSVSMNFYCDQQPYKKVQPRYTRKGNATKSVHLTIATTASRVKFACFPIQRSVKLTQEVLNYEVYKFNREL